MHIRSFQVVDQALVAEEWYSRWHPEVVRHYPDLLELDGEPGVADMTHCQSMRVGAGTIASDVLSLLNGADPIRTFSVGMAATPELARLSSAMAGAAGVLVIAPWDAREFLQEVPISRLLPIAPRLLAQLHHAGLDHCGSIASKRRDWMDEHFGPNGVDLWLVSQGREIEVRHSEMAVERVLPPQTKSRPTLDTYLITLCLRILRTLAARGGSAAQLWIQMTGLAGTTVKSPMPVPGFSRYRASWATPVRQWLDANWNGHDVRCIKVWIAPGDDRRGQTDMFACD